MMMTALATGPVRFSWMRMSGSSHGIDVPPVVANAAGALSTHRAASAPNFDPFSLQCFVTRSPPWSLGWPSLSWLELKGAVGRQAGDVNELGDAPPAATALDVDDEADRLRDERPLRRHAGLLGQVVEPEQRGRRVVGVDGRAAAGTPRVPTLEEVERLPAADLPDDDPLGGEVDGRLDQRREVDVARGAQRRVVLGRALQLHRVLEQDEALAGLTQADHLVEDRVDEGGLA